MSKRIYLVEDEKSLNLLLEKYILVTSSTNGYASYIIIKTGESVMTWGFSGTDKAITLAEFKQLVKKGEVRYVMVGGQGGGSNNEIMTWAKAKGKLVPESEWKDSIESISNTPSNSTTGTNSDAANITNNSTKASDSKNHQFGGGSSEQLYDLKAADTTTK